MNDNQKDKLDAQILKALEDGPKKFHQIWAVTSEKFQRPVDRRLQTLRKKGLITFDSKSGWELRKPHVKQ